MPDKDQSPIIWPFSFPVRSEIICYRYDNTARRTNFQPVCVCVCVVSLANGSDSIRQTAYAVNGCINARSPGCREFSSFRYLHHHHHHRHPIAKKPAAIALSRSWVRRHGMKNDRVFNEYWYYYTFHRWNSGTSFEFPRLRLNNSVENRGWEKEWGGGGRMKGETCKFRSNYNRFLIFSKRGGSIVWIFHELSSVTLATLSECDDRSMIMMMIFRCIYYFFHLEDGTRTRIFMEICVHRNETLFFVFLLCMKIIILLYW